VRRKRLGPLGNKMLVIPTRANQVQGLTALEYSSYSAAWIRVRVTFPRVKYIL
jgi:hypothetical protein